MALVLRAKYPLRRKQSVLHLLTDSVTHTAGLAEQVPSASQLKAVCNSILVVALLIHARLLVRVAASFV